jgi:AraC-like DNA-binding protein
MKPPSRVSRLYEVMDLMLDSVGDPLALKSLAASASYSSFHFDRIFRELTGFSAVEYQRKRRLRRAAHLLRHEPDVAVVRIAQDCGFPSNAAFAKAFKQQFSMSAKAWREGGWRDYMDQQVGRESDVSFFVAEPDNLEALLAPYCPPQPGTIAARICVRMLPAVLMRYQRFFGQSGAALSIACNDVIRERERLDATMPASAATAVVWGVRRGSRFHGRERILLRLRLRRRCGPRPGHGFARAAGRQLRLPRLPQRMAALPLDVRGLARQTNAVAAGQHPPAHPDGRAQCRSALARLAGAADQETIITR